MAEENTFDAAELARKIRERNAAKNTFDAASLAKRIEERRAAEQSAKEDAPAKSEPYVRPWETLSGSEKLAENVGGIIDPLLRLGTSAVAGPVSDVAGLSALAANYLGLTDKLPLDVKNAVLDKLTYQPRTSTGAAPSNILNFVPTQIGRAFEAISVPESSNPSTPGGMTQNFVRAVGQQIPAFIGAKGSTPSARARAYATIGDVNRQFVGKVSGAGDSSFETIYNIFRESDPAIRQRKIADYAAGRGAESGAAMDEIVQRVREARQRIAEQRGEMYRSGMANITSDRTVLDLLPVQEKLAEMNATRGKFKGWTKSQQTVDALQRASEKLNEFASLDPAEYHTAAGFDSLKQALWDIEESYPPGSAAREAISQIRQEVKSQVSTQAPTYANLMSDVEALYDFEREVQRSLGADRRTSTETAMRKLQGAMRDNVNTSFSYRKNLLDELERESGVDITPFLAGQATAPWYPRGLAGVIEPIAGAATGAAMATPGNALMSTIMSAALAPLMSSPRVIGKGYELAGRVARNMDPLMNTAGQPAALAAFGPMALSGPLSRSDYYSQPGALVRLPPAELEEERSGAQ